MKVDYQHLYIRNEHSMQPQPRVTACYIRVNGKTHVGIALCSQDDNPSKKVGRSIAHTRAVSAMEGKSCPMGRTEAMYLMHHLSQNLMSRFQMGAIKYLLRQDVTGKAFTVESEDYMITYLHDYYKDA